MHEALKQFYSPRQSIVVAAYSAIAALIIYLVPVPTLAGVLIIAISLGIIATIGFHNRSLFTPLVVAFIARLSIALVYTAIPELDPDPDGYGIRAVEWAVNGLSGTFEHFTTGAYLYSWLISLLYATTGESEFTVRAVNVLLGVLVVWCTYILAFELWNSKRIALRAAWLTAIFPNLIRFSASFPSREALIILSLIIAITLFVRWIKREKFQFILGSMVFFVISISLHTGMLVGLFVVGLIVIITACRDLLRHRLRSMTRGVAATLVVVLSLGLIWISGWGLEKVGEELTLSGGIEQLRSLGEESAIGRAAYLQDARADSMTDVIRILPLRIGYFMFAPTIWMAKTPLDLLGVIDGLFYVVLVWCLFRSRKYIWGNILARNILFIVLVIVTIFAMATSNYGTAIRHRAKVAPVLISLLVLSPLSRHRRIDFKSDGVSDGNNTEG